MIKNILEKIRDGLASDSILNDYCVETFGNKPKIYLGVNHQNPPNDNPCIIITSVTFSSAANRNIYKIQMFFSCNDETQNIVGDKKTFEGFLKAEELREKSEEAIFRIRFSLGKMTLESQSIDNMIFPVWTSNSNLIFETIKTSRN
jgi:hypothetical protein